MTEKQFPKKWLKKVQESGWQEAADSMGTDELKRKIVEFEKAISEQEYLMEEDEFLQKLKTDMKERKAIYMEPIGELVANIKYSVFALESRGEVVAKGMDGKG